MPRKNKQSASKKTRAKGVGATPAPGPAKANMSVGRALGTMLGSKIGMGPIGGALGNLAQNALSKIFGKGDYSEFTVEKNSLLIPRHADSVPLFGSEDGVVRVRHREFLQDVRVASTTGAFEVTGYPLIPNNGAVFPWLSPMAELFEQYRILGMIFEFKTTATTAVLNAVNLGSVFMATQYNAYMPGFSSKRQMLNHYFGCSSVIRDSLIHPIECKEMYDPLKCYYTRPINNGPLPGRDVRFEDFGNFYIATQGVPNTNVAGTVIGELWVSYDIIFFKPRINTGAAVVVFDPPPLAPPDDINVVHIPFGACCDDDQKEEQDFATLNAEIATLNAQVAALQAQLPSIAQKPVGTVSDVSATLTTH